MRVMFTYALFSLTVMLGAAQDPEGWEKIEIDPEAEEAPPGPGWEKVGKRDNGITFAGVWERKDGKAAVALGTFEELPEMVDLLGLTHSEVDPSQFPIRVESLKKPLLGMRFTFDRDSDGWEELQRIFLMEKGGGRILMVELKKDATFDLNSWTKKDYVHLEDEILRAGFEAKAAEMTLLIENPPKIEIDPSLTPPVKDSERSEPTGKFVVRVELDGSFLVDGVVRNEEVLVELMEKAVKAEPKTVLHVRADKETEFRWVRKLIRLGAKAGIDQVAYGVLKKDETGGDR